MKPLIIILAIVITVMLLPKIQVPAPLGIILFLGGGIGLLHLCINTTQK